jgi:hypothetical protein
MTQIPLQSRFKQDIVRLRFDAGSYTRGLYVDGAVTATEYKASVQPFVDKGSEVLQRLREGDRTKKLIVIYTYPDTLRTASEKPNNTRADLVYYEGEVYEIQRVNRWKGQILSHDEVWGLEFDAGQLYPGEVPSDVSHVETNGTTVNIFGIGSYLTGSIASAFTLYVNGVETTFTPVQITGSYLGVVEIESDTVILSTDTVTFDYDGSLTSILTGDTDTVTGGVIVNRSTQTAGYKLDDDGTNTALFNEGWLETNSPSYNRAQYTLTGTPQTLVALPSTLDTAPGLVPLVEGVPLVCGFKINSVPTAGSLSECYFSLYNYGGSGSVLFNVSFGKSSDVTTGEIKAQAGTFPPSVSQFGTSYLGELVGAKIAIEATLTAGSLVARVFVNGTLIGTSTGIATDGGMFATMQVRDDTGSVGLVDIECVPTVAAGLNGTYGTFATGAKDMIGGLV